MPNPGFGSRGLAILAGVASSIVASLVYPYIAYFLTQEQGYSLTEAASLIGFATAINVIVRLVAGRLIDHIHLYKLATIGLILAVALPVFLVWHPTWGAVLFGLVTYTAGAVLFGASMTLVIYSTDEPEVEQKINFSYYYAASNLFLGLAPIAIFCFAVDSYRMVFISAIFLQLVSIVGVLLMLIRRAPKQQKKNSPPPKMMRAYSGLFTKEFAIIFLIGCGYSCIYQQLTSNISLLLKDTQVWGRDVYPVLIAINGLMIVAIQPFYVRVLKKHQTQDVLLPGVFMLLVSVAFLTLPTPLLYALLPFALLFTMAEFFVNLGLTDALIAVAPFEARGTWISCFALSRMAGAVGVPLGSMIIEDYGVSSYTWALLGVCGVILSLSYVSSKLRRANHCVPVDEATSC